MTYKNRIKNVVVIQARLNPKIIFAEQANFRKLIKSTDFKLTFVNPLQDSNWINWNNPDGFLNKYGSSIWLGSAEIDLSQPSPEREKYQNRVLSLAQKILRENEPALGICLGHQTFALVSGTKIVRNKKNREFGTTFLKLTRDGEGDPIFRNLHKPISMVFAHNDSVINLPSGFTIIASTTRNRFSVLRKGRIVTVQGHPEIVDTSSLKKRVILAQKNTSFKLFNFTSPLVNPGSTDLIIKNFLTQTYLRTNMF